MTKADKELLERHTHKIVHIKERNCYRTQIDIPGDFSSDYSYKQITSKTLEGLQRKIVDHYKGIDTTQHKSVHELYEGWMAERMQYHEIEAATKDRMDTDFIRFFVDSGFSKRKINTITERDLTLWIKDQIATHKLTHKGWANFRCIISGIFKYAKDLGYTEISISTFLSDLRLPDRMFKRTFKDDKQEVFTDSELQQIIDWIQDPDYPDRQESLANLGILLCICTGLRAGELSALKWDDVTERALLVTRTQTRHKEPDGQYSFVVRESTKGREGRRRIAIPAEAHAILDRIRQQRIPGEYVFMSRRTGQRMKADTFSGKLVRICHYLGIPVRRLHKIRKTYASMLLDAGVEESIVTAQMGHTTITTTKSFYYRDRHTEKEKIDAITNALNGTRKA